MKGLLRGMVAVGLLAGGLLAAGCTEEQRRSHNEATPIAQKYQSPETPAGQQAGDQRKSHPAADDEERWRERTGHSQTARLPGESIPGQEDTPPVGGGTTAPGSLQVPEGPGIGGAGTELPREGLGLGLAESYQVPAGQGGAGLPVQDVSPEQRRRQQGQGSQGVGNVGQQAPTVDGQ